MIAKRAALIAAVLLGSGAAAHAQDSRLVQRSAMNRVKGQSDAPLTVYEIADFECPFCARFAREIFPRIDSAYVKTGKAQWVFVNFPLPTHAHAWAAAEAAMCAGGVSEQFWPMHDRIFQQQPEWTGSKDPGAVFAQYAKELGLPAEAYEACVRNDKVAALIVRDLLHSHGSGATGTPAFIINTEPIFAGLRSYEEWKEMLDAALKKAPAK